MAKQPQTKGKGNEKSNSRNPADWNDITFINMPLNEAQQKDFKSRREEMHGCVPEFLLTFGQAGYKFSITFDENNSCFIASVTCKRALDPNFGYCLTSRSDDAIEALALCAYKTYFCCPECDWIKDTQSRNWG